MPAADAWPRGSKSSWVRRDFRFATQLEDAASSVARNIAEGFGRVRPKEFARFLLIARGSLFELSDLLADGAGRGYWSEAETSTLRALCKRTTGAVNGLVRYLNTAKATEAAGRWEGRTSHG